MHKWAGFFYCIVFLTVITLCIESDLALAQPNQKAGEVEIQQTTPAEMDSVQAAKMAELEKRNRSKKNNIQSKNKPTEISDIGSFWELTKLGGKVRWAIFAVLVVGIILIIQKIVQLIAEQHQSKPLLGVSINSMTLEEITRTVDESPKNMIKELFEMLIEIFETTGQSAVFHEEIANFVTYQQDRFKTFNNRLAFLSDTAGALGLLGTVWGMFQTFFGGNMDKQVILDGMGVALITTLMGLVVSIILNFFGTEIFSFFNKRLEVLQIKADEFRMRISRIEKSRQKKVEAERRMLETEAEASKVTAKTVAVQPNRETVGPPFKLAYVSGDGQTTEVNKQLEYPLVVELLDANDCPIPGQMVRFAVEKGNGNLSNGGQIQEILTNKMGRVATNLIIGSKAGENVVKTTSPSLNGHFIEFMARGMSGAPEEMILVSGNNLAGPAGSTLKEPFVVLVKDSFDNPIPDFQVNFKVSMGNGFFTGRKSKYTVITDANGKAQAYFTLGTKQGFNRITVTGKKLRRSKIEIQAMGQ